ncbi:putative colanic acid biosysnthesis UDP-glucose lipid carrier transferase [Hyunsoonleella jejuensis]|uniref:Putative colanic acid biosysnthesis UDP-glucose lipid carrier transferase n=1 Tax=Hyunsoonleella jejuensis TaxID=419940 RepID=A0A1H9AZ92_9FLAO|nr:undecaprenyl-phosphate glucose phosphotransferase [Hyunsoonleella jejuensis]SEP81753.1 putative colanic acid biosysnthesis UDP-glucose lipid carrier transferase [Hyunsoonleella jejuensis]
MKVFKQGRYSGFIKPISFLVDLVIINSSVFFFNINLSDKLMFFTYISVLWFIISFYNRFYEIQRNTRIIQILTLLLKQTILFSIVLYAFIGFFKQPNISRINLGNYLLFVFLVLTFFKFLIFFLLNKYRSVLGGNIRLVVVIGKNEKTRQLINIFNKRLDFGYKFMMQFSVKEEDFSLSKCFDYIIDNDIDEIYFSVSELSNKQINELINFADNNLRELKFIPDNKEIFSKKLKYEYYDYIPVLSLRDIPLKESINKIVKRAFDILFSLFIIVFILSWLTPLLAILIKLESRGPVFFKQSRNGFNYKEFDCYKFRSMTPNKNAHLHQATKGDSRVTKVGAFIRKTSIDELPQFFNVLFGDMSVVGPRPHMVSHTNMYARKIDKFMVRHFVKPGITGLAQVSGFRGEIETDKDIINRVKYDIFYIENWSLLLDIKIIVQTFLNALRGEKKAY